MEEKRFIEILNNNNKNLEEMVDKKIKDNNVVLEEMMDRKIKDNNVVLEEMMDRKIKDNNVIIEEKIRHNYILFEHTYGQKIDALYDKIMLDNQIREKREKEIDEYIEKNEKKFLSHEFRISKLEEAVNL